jgi:hypothetical protein
VQATLQPMREIEEGEAPKMLEAHGPEPVEEAPPAPAPPPPPARPKRAEPIAMAEEAPAPPPAPAAPKAAPAVFEMPDISAAPPARAAAPAPPEPAAASPAMVGDPFAVSAPAPAQASAKAPAAPAPPPARPARPMEEVPLAHAPAPPVFEEQEVLAGAPSVVRTALDSESSSIPLLDLPDVIHAEPPSAKAPQAPTRWRCFHLHDTASEGARTRRASGAPPGPRPPPRPPPVSRARGNRPFRGHAPSARNRRAGARPWIIRPAYDPCSRRANRAGSRGHRGAQGRRARAKAQPFSAPSMRRLRSFLPRARIAGKKIISSRTSTTNRKRCAEELARRV